MSPAPELEAQITTEVRRLVDRLATLTAVRMAQPAPPYASRAVAAHTLAQRLIDVTAEMDQGPSRQLPWIDELTVVDQLAVTAQDLRSALAISSTLDRARLTELLDEIARVRAAVR